MRRKFSQRGASRIPAPVRGDVLTLFRARATDARAAAVTLRVGEETIGRAELDETMREFRFRVPTAALHAGTTQVTLSVEAEGAPIDLDHLLFLPPPTN